MLVDPVQFAFLPDTKGLESGLKNFVDGFLFFVGILDTGSLTVEIPVPVRCIKWLALR